MPFEMSPSACIAASTRRQRNSIQFSSRVRAYPGDDDVNKRKINTVWRKKKAKEIASSHIRIKLRTAVKAIGEDKLGFTADDIGCHSLRSGAAIAMKLSGVSEYTIMLIGRWKSLAFLDYIRRQVAEFSFDISDRMLTHGNFFTTPEYRHDHSIPTLYSEKITGGAIDRVVSRPFSSKNEEPTHGT